MASRIFFHAAASDEGGDVVGTVNGKAADDGVPQFGVVVHKGGGGIFAHLFDGLEKLSARTPRAVNNDGDHLFFGVFGQQSAQNHTRAGHGNKQQ